MTHRSNTTILYPSRINTKNTRRRPGSITRTYTHTHTQRRLSSYRQFKKHRYRQVVVLKSTGASPIFQAGRRLILSQPVVSLRNCNAVRFPKTWEIILVCYFAMGCVGAHYAKSICIIISFVYY